MSDEEHPAYVLLCGVCGKMKGCTVDTEDWKRDTAKFLAGGIRRGFSVERTTVGRVRQGWEWCDCPRKKKGASSSQGVLL